MCAFFRVCEKIIARAMKSTGDNVHVIASSYSFYYNRFLSQVQGENWNFKRKQKIKIKKVSFHATGQNSAAEKGTFFSIKHEKIW